MTLSCHLYYDATVAVALSTAFALVVALIAAVIVGGSAPDLSVARSEEHTSELQSLV